jgi:two-component system invasion response regulator UvrY
MIKILIADDHKIFRKGLKQTIEDEHGMEVFGEAADGNEVLSMISKHHFDVVLLDFTMPGPSGLDILKQIKSDYPDLPVLFLSMHPEEQYALRALRAGAAGYLTKEADEANLILAIRKANNGGKYVTPSIAEKLAFSIEIDLGKPPHELLSDREYQVMCLIARGKKVTEISEELCLGVSTISTYRTRILEKMKMKNNAELTHYAIKNNIVD